ncbi:MAG: rod shape-determining protein RodA [Spirochaetales bacterium]|nr:rod shape-determining protein RodA [Spirochaetales bacterium]
MNKRGSLFSLDLPILISVFALVVIGILFIYSSNTDTAGNMVKDEFIRQIVWAVIGMGVLVFFSFFNYLNFRDYAWIIYIVVMVMLLVTLIIGRDVNGARSWLGIGGVGVQPSEFAKLATILFLGFYLDRVGQRIRNLPHFLLAFLICLAPIFMVLLQPDMGTALVFIPIFIVMTWTAGTKRRYLVFLVSFGFLFLLFLIMPELAKYFPVFADTAFQVFTVPRYLLIFSFVVLGIGILSYLGYFFFRAAYYYWITFGSAIFFSSSIIVGLMRIIGIKGLQAYQIKRLIIFLNPYIDAQKEGYNIIQSITAVGSGGFFGKGFRSGTQSQLKYLPMQSNDFIFPIIAEEWGLVGATIVLLLFTVLLYRSLKIVRNSPDRYAQLIGAGIVGMIFYHCVINIGMTMGLMPITGIPLIFISYGGSSLLTGLMCIGIILNIYFRRYSA